MVYKALHIALAGLLWLSSTGLVLNKHYCQDILRDVALFAKAENCHSRMAREHEDMPASCPMHQAKAVKETHERGCCDDTAEYLHLDDDLLKTEAKYSSFDLPPFIAHAWNTAGLILYDILSSSIDYLHYKPPVLICDRSVSLQVFLL